MPASAPPRPPKAKGGGKSKAKRQKQTRPEKQYRQTIMRMRPTRAQRKALAKANGISVLAQNDFLASLMQQWRDYEADPTNHPRPDVTYEGMCEAFPAWRDGHEKEWVNEEANGVTRTGLKRLALSYRRFLSGLSRFPRFRSFHIRSFDVDCDPRRRWLNPLPCPLDAGAKRRGQFHARLHVPGIGKIIVRGSKAAAHQFKGLPLKKYTVKQRRGKWVVILCHEHPPAPVCTVTPAHAQNPIGLDLGVARFITTSQGEVISPNRQMRHQAQQREKRAKRTQQTMARQKQGSKGWQKNRQRLQANRHKAAQVRRDFAPQTSRRLAQGEHDLIVVEALRIPAMIASAKGTPAKPGRDVGRKKALNRSIAAQGWGQFLRILEYKLTHAGKALIKVNPRYTSPQCSHCGEVHRESRRSQAGYQCIACGFELNADHNAALNIPARATGAGAAHRGRAPRPARPRPPPGGPGVSDPEKRTGSPVCGPPG